MQTPPMRTRPFATSARQSRKRSGLQGTFPAVNISRPTRQSFACKYIAHVLTIDRTGEETELLPIVTAFVTKVHQKPSFAVTRMCVPKLVKNGFYYLLLGIWGQFPALQLFLTCLQYPPFSNLHRCLMRLNGKATIVIDGSDKAAETCCLALGDRK
jgi:hypothetical protein